MENNDLLARSYANELSRDCVNSDLLTALQDMVRWAIGESDSYPYSKWGAYPPEAVIKARSAINKATGKD